MSKNSCRLLICGLLSLLLFACTSPCDSTLTGENVCTPPGSCPDSHVLNVPIVRRQQGMWCWAAVGQMCMQFVNVAASQCDQANFLFNHSDCCSAGASTIDVNTRLADGCNHGGWPPFNTSKYPVTATQSSDNTYLSFCELKNQLGCLHKPVAFAWLFNSSNPDIKSGHIMVATGYFVGCDGTPYLLINNPQPPDANPPPGASADADPQILISYNEFKSGSYFTHWRDYYDIAKKPEPADSH